MNEKIFNLRRMYFSFLYTSFIYIGLLLLILGKNVKPVKISFFEESVMAITGIIPAIIFFLKKTGYIFEEKRYAVLLLIGQIPLITGSLLSFIYSNYIYFFISYPIFLLVALVLLPTKKSVEKKDG
ncbi:hypothetical protein [Persephonella hydrogeniphila]|nr:hypothetical protein [Persephonella hydrogeniphila]